MHREQQQRQDRPCREPSKECIEVGVPEPQENEYKRNKKERKSSSKSDDALKEGREDEPSRYIIFIYQLIPRLSTLLSPLPRAARKDLPRTHHNAHVRRDIRRAFSPLLSQRRIHPRDILISLSAYCFRTPHDPIDETAKSSHLISCHLISSSTWHGIA
jgi:hypothetical protein